jgi:hypothetical protein
VEPIREKAEYDLHQNVVTDLGYQRFLSRIIPHLDPRFVPDLDWLAAVAAKHQATQMQAQLGNGTTRILDFGCGPSPVLAMQLATLGYRVHVYDKYFARFPENLQPTYDAIVSTEVLEHVWQAADVWALFDRLIADQGRIIVMTKRVTDLAAFAQWHYIHDPTHICYYSDTTARYIGERFGWQVALPSPDIMVFSKNSRDNKSIA